MKKHVLGLVATYFLVASNYDLVFNNPYLFDIEETINAYTQHIFKPEQF